MSATLGVCLLREVALYMYMYVLEYTVIYIDDNMHTVVLCMARRDLISVVLIYVCTTKMFIFLASQDLKEALPEGFFDDPKMDAKACV